MMVLGVVLWWILACWRTGVAELFDLTSRKHRTDLTVRGVCQKHGTLESCGFNCLIELLVLALWLRQRAPYYNTAWWQKWWQTVALAS